MRILFYSWNSNNEKILADNLSKAGMEVVWFQKACKHYTRDLELASEMIQAIHGNKSECVVSFNYFPILSMICNTCQIPYFAWVYDCPHFTLYAKQLALACNHIGIFDADMVLKLQAYGIQTVFHVPLSVDAAYFAQKIQEASKQEKERFQCDISFVGSLYSDEHNYYDMFFADASGQNEKMNEVIDKQCFAYREKYLEEAVQSGIIDLAFLQDKMSKQGLLLGEDYFAGADEVLMAAVLEKKVTVEERKKLLTCLASEFGDKYRFCLYTGSDTGKLPMLQKYNYGMVDYHKQMPLVFAESKINLNISLRSIHTGIPLRVLDIMACGGFVLTNWQEEIAENFREGIEIVTFQSLEECLQKAAYYLEHEEERKAIAAAGQVCVKQNFSYEQGLNCLFA